LVGACSAIFGVDVPEQTVTAACGLCVFHDPDAKGCYWAVELDGAYYAVNGDTPADHEPHAPGGMCTMPRKAVVAGELRGKQLFASKFELLPVDPASLPAADALPAHQH
ncbi:MAG TPA: DUF6370 family protein, partial [Myxococcota bacterium]|nr:DUF6370 family protein [Myxococcota bacterium]